MDASSELPKSQLPRPSAIKPDETVSQYLGRFRLEPDLLGRYLWLTDRLSVSESAKLKLENRNFKRFAKGKPDISWVTIYFSQRDASNCVLTHDALMTSFFGPNCYNKLRLLNRDPIVAINELRNRMLSREASSSFGSRVHCFLRGHSDVAPDPLNKTNWSVYSVKIYKGDDASSRECLHAFAILQSFENNNLVYKILQSYIGMYNFNEHDISYNSAEIQTLLNELGELFSSNTWNSRNLHLFSHFFKNSTLPNLGKPISYKRNLELRIGDVTRTSFEDISKQYIEGFPADFKIKVSKK